MLFFECPKSLENQNKSIKEVYMHSISGPYTQNNLPRTDHPTTQLSNSVNSTEIQSHSVYQSCTCQAVKISYLSTSCIPPFVFLPTSPTENDDMSLGHCSDHCNRVNEEICDQYFVEFRVDDTTCNLLLFLILAHWSWFREREKKANITTSIVSIYHSCH